MTGAGMQRMVEKVFFALIRFEINGDELCDEMKNLITPEMLPALFKLSKRHDLAHLIGDALDKNGLLPDGTEAKKRFLQERNMAVYRYEQIQYEFEQICETLENAKVPFIPLKGSVIRQFYPEPWMRTSCDIDVLVDKSNLEQAKECLVRDLEYQVEDVESSHDISLYAPSGVHLELHHSLVEEGRAQSSSDILYGVWENVIESHSYQKEMLDEIFYFYHVAHMAKHFEIGGCGVRPFLDSYLLLHHAQYRTEACYRLLQQGRLLTFAKAVEETSNVWFGKMETTSLSREIQDYVLYAGMYADTENRAAVQQAKKGGSIQYLWSRIFLPYEQLKLQYPTLEKYKILLPFYQVKRWCRLLFGKDSKNVSRELKANVYLQSDKKERIAKLLKDLEL